MKHKVKIVIVTIIISLFIPPLNINAAVSPSTLDLPAIGFTHVVNYDTSNSNSSAYGMSDAPIANTTGNFLILSTGSITDDYLSNDSGIFLDHALSNNLPDTDRTQIEVVMTPPNAQACFEFQFEFLTEEYPDFVGSQYNDNFIAELMPSDVDSAISGTNSIYNIAFDGNGNAINLNSYGFDGSPTNSPFNGSSGILKAKSKIGSLGGDGNVKVIFTVTDGGDNSFDTAVFINHVAWNTTDSECTTGVQVVHDEETPAVTAKPKLIMYGLDSKGSGLVNDNGVTKVNAGKNFQVVANQSEVGDAPFKYNFYGACSGNITTDKKYALSNVLNLAAGKYLCGAKITDADGDTYNQSIAITVNAVQTTPIISQTVPVSYAEPTKKIDAEISSYPVSFTDNNDSSSNNSVPGAQTQTLPGVLIVIPVLFLLFGTAIVIIKKR